MPQSFAFLLLPGFSALGFIATLEPLRVANRFRPGSYRWRILGREGAAVTASNGMSVNVDSGLDALEAGTTLFVVAGFEPLAHRRRQHVAHEAALDLLGLRPRAPHRLAHRDGAEVGGREAGESALERADGGADGTRDHHVLGAHGFSVRGFFAAR